MVEVRRSSDERAQDVQQLQDLGRVRFHLLRRRRIGQLVVDEYLQGGLFERSVPVCEYHPFELRGVHISEPIWRHALDDTHLPRPVWDEQRIHGNIRVRLG